MASAEISNSVITVKTDFHENDVMTQMPGARHTGNNVWRLPLSWASCITLRGVFGLELVIGDKLKEWSWTEFEERIKPALELREALELSNEGAIAKAIDSVEKGTGLHLRPFQRAGVAFLVSCGQALLFDVMGTGKTVQMIRTTQVLREMGHQPFPLLVVCPKSLMYTVWQRELSVWAPDLTVTVVDGNVAQRRKQLAEKTDVFIVNWDLLRKHSRLAPFGSIRLTDEQKRPKELNELSHQMAILDEAHRLRSVGQTSGRGEGAANVPTSQQSLAAWAVCHQAKFRYALTGTPVNNNVGDLWGLLHAILPDWFPAKTRYLDRYAEVGLNWFGGHQVLGLRASTSEEFRKITEPTWRRILKQAVLPQLPSWTEPQIRHTPMTPQQQRLYTQMEEQMLAETEDGGIFTAGSPLMKLTWLMQFAAANADVSVTRDDQGKIHQHVTLKSPSNKVEDLVELLSEMGDDPLVVVAESRQLIELAAQRLMTVNISHGLVTGAQLPDERANAVDQFQRGKTRVILLTLGAGAEGLTLTRSDAICFMQESWSPLVNSQALGRIDRIGAEYHDSLKLIKQITPGTVEARKISALAGKGDRIEEVLQDRQTIRRLLGK